MKENSVTKKLLNFLDDVEDEVGYFNVRHEAKKWREKLKKASKKIKIKNWSLMKEEKQE